MLIPSDRVWYSRFWKMSTSFKLKGSTSGRYLVRSLLRLRLGIVVDIRSAPRTSQRQFKIQIESEARPVNMPRLSVR
jgi:hypothetical protein